MKLTLATWNVLAAAYIRRDYYPATPDSALEPRARIQRVVDCLVALEADVLCLQEAERPLFEAASARLVGYEGQLGLKGGGKPDGCAVFVRAPARLVGTRELRYPDGSGHLALLAAVEAPSLAFTVATTHLKWDPPGTPVANRFGLRQAEALLEERLGPWVVCGDFNVDPDDAVVERFRAAGFRDAFPGPGRFTCNANRRARRIDFVLHTPELVVDPLPLRVIDAQTPLPSADEPSDHLPLGVRIGCARPA